MHAAGPASDAKRMAARGPTPPKYALSLQLINTEDKKTYKYLYRCVNESKFIHKNEPTSPIEGEDVPFTLGSTLGRVGL